MARLVTEYLNATVLLVLATFLGCPGQLVQELVLTGWTGVKPARTFNQVPALCRFYLPIFLPERLFPAPGKVVIVGATGTHGDGEGFALVLQLFLRQLIVR